MPTILKESINENEFQNLVFLNMEVKLLSIYNNAVSHLHQNIPNIWLF